MLLKEALSISGSAIKAPVSTLQVLTPDVTAPECSVRKVKKAVTNLAVQFPAQPSG